MQKVSNIVHIPDKINSVTYLKKLLENLHIIVENLI